MSDENRRASSFLATKGLFPDATYRALQRWDLSASLEDNVRHLRSQNTVGGPSLGWVKDFGKVLLRRLGPMGPEPVLVELAQRRCDPSVWNPLWLWHAARTDPLLFSFIADWLFAEQERGVVRVTTQAAESFLRQHLGGAHQKWSDSNVKASANGLLRTAAVFGLISGGRVRQFAPYRVPDETFLYCAHDLTQRIGSAARMVADRSWRLFLMTRAAVETELLRLHQMGRLHFSRAGTLVELRLPFDSAAEYARRAIA
jgi:hypothetical protein